MAISEQRPWVKKVERLAYDSELSLRTALSGLAGHSKITPMSGKRRFLIKFRCARTHYESFFFFLIFIFGIMTHTRHEN